MVLGSGFPTPGYARLFLLRNFVFTYKFRVFHCALFPSAKAKAWSIHIYVLFYVYKQHFADINTK